MPRKPDKYRLKFWLCVDIDSHYVFNTFPYIGQQSTEQRQTQMGVKTVLEFLKPFYGSSRNVTIDNFFYKCSISQRTSNNETNSYGNTTKK